MGGTGDESACPPVASEGDRLRGPAVAGAKNTHSVTVTVRKDTGFGPSGDVFEPAACCRIVWVETMTTVTVEVQFSRVSVVADTTTTVSVANTVTVSGMAVVEVAAEFGI